MTRMMQSQQKQQSCSDTAILDAEGDEVCILFARDRAEAIRHCLILQENGIAADVGGNGCGRTTDVHRTLGVPVMVGSADRERASGFLASLEAAGAAGWNGDEDEDLEDEDEDDDDEFFPDEADDFDDEDEEDADDDGDDNLV